VVESVLRGAAVYFVILIIVRLSGRRTMAEVTVFDLVLILIIAETTQQALLGDDFSIVNAALLIVTLFAMDIGMSYVKQYLPIASKVLDGTPTLLLSHGKLDERAMKRARVDKEEILSSARFQMAVERLDQIKYAVLESDGNISIIPVDKK
jgi:uncharacterized membrane protein YcaP (DUF421 family)